MKLLKGAVNVKIFAVLWITFWILRLIIMESYWFCIVAGELHEGINFELLMTSAGKGTEVVYKTGPSEHLLLIAGNMMTVGKSEWVMV